MRKTLKLIAVLLIVISTAPAGFAFDSTTTDTKLKVWSTADRFYKVSYKDSDERNVEIKIVDDRKAILYSERINSTEGFVKPFDLTHLPAGAYTIKVITRENEYSETIKLVSAFEKYGKLITIFQAEESKKFTLNIDESVDVDLTVKLLNRDGKLLHQGIISRGSKLYNLNRVPSQEVTVLVFKGDDIVMTSYLKL